MSRYVFLGLIAVTLSLAYGIRYSCSVILVALLRGCGWSRSAPAAASSVFSLVRGGVNPLLGMLCDRVRPLRTSAAREAR